MSDSNTTPFKQQLTKWWGLVSKKDTWDSFKAFFALTWNIIKETGILIWLFLLGGLVSIGWVVDRSTELTESVKSLQSQADQSEDGNLVAEAGKSLWTATKKGADNALKTARTTLDIKAPEKKTKVNPPNQEEDKQKKANQSQAEEKKPPEEKESSQASDSSKNAQNSADTPKQGSAKDSEEQDKYAGGDYQRDSSESQETEANEN